MSGSPGSMREIHVAGGADLVWMSTPVEAP